MGQRDGRRGLKPLLILSATIMATATARAEQLVMPFACSARGGEVRLTPSEANAYQIYGKREHHIFTVCSPIDATRCRNWMIHRFEMDCGGERVSWLNVADAARPYAARRYMRGRAFVEAGKMHLTVGPLWFAGREGPLADRLWARRAERFGNGPMDEVIDLPPGFAPTFGLPVSFEGGTGPSNSLDAVEGPPPAPKFYADGEAGPDAEAYGPRTERRYAQGSAEEFDGHDNSEPRAGATQHEAAPLDKSAPVDLPLRKPAQAVQSPPKEKSREPESASKLAQPEKAAAKPEALKAPAPTPAVKPEAPKTVPPKAEVAAADAPKPAAREAQQGPIVPTILNAPGAAKPAAAPPAQPPGAAPTAPLSAAEKSALPTPQPVPKSGGSEQKVVSAEASAKTETAVPVIGLPSPASTDQGKFALAPWHWLVASGAAALLLGLAWLLTRRGGGYDAGLPRDLSAISLEGGFGAGTSLVPASEPPSPTVAAEAEAPASPPTPATAEIRMPTTLPEALEVLGASADAEPPVLKKIVGALRQSWHPDLARSNRDRRYREQRMAQINVAWDIIEASLRPAA